MYPAFPDSSPSAPISVGDHRSEPKSGNLRADRVRS